MNLIQNVGETDRKYRAIAAVIAVLFGLSSGNPLAGILIAAVLLATAYTRKCPLYQIMDMNTNSK